MQIKRRIELVKLMQHLGLPMTAAEVGVAQGLFSQELLYAGIEKLYLIDLWETVPFIRGCASFDPQWHESNYDRVTTELQKEILAGRAILLQGFSYKMAELIPDNSLGMAYIDADHTYEGVRADIDAFLPKIVPGGIIAFHDYANPDYGVRRAVDNYLQGRVEATVIEEDGSVENIGAYFIKQ
jgi:hypothetical protein